MRKVETKDFCSLLLPGICGKYGIKKSASFLVNTEFTAHSLQGLYSYVHRRPQKETGLGIDDI